MKKGLLPQTSKIASQLSAISMQFLNMTTPSKKPSGGQFSKKDTLKWLEEMDDVLVDAMIEQQNNGNRVDGMFTTAAYTQMTSICQEKLGISLTKDHLKNRIKTLKNNFVAAYEIFKNASGVQWSESKKMFDATNEIWDELIKAKKWRTKPIHNYDKLCVLFAPDRTTGDDAFAGAFFNNAPEDETPQDPFLQKNVIFDETRDEASSFQDDAISSKSKRKRSAVSETIDKRLQDSESGLLWIASALENGQLTIRKANRPRVEEEFTRKEIFTELERLEVDPSKIVDAYLLLSADKEKTKTFFGAPEAYRLNVIYRMMSQN
ncbi:uncharacterized protein LOC141817238 isoform X2 [Curcuma longa]|uniref:uncharacterized protein LOC141817238 isoform X2 n=1 Tax=Curcuma longa TaxID=136217 RepID=UPI003D9F2D84